jgi:hypothetical protein
MQDEHGDAIGGINTDDEPVPYFVHDIARTLLLPATEVSAAFESKSVARCHVSSAGEHSYQSKLAVIAKTANPVHADITRVMIGRIEIVTLEQRALLAQISNGSALVAFNDFETRKLNLPNNEAWNEVNSGKKTFAVIGFEVPDLLRAYLQLGRCRNALLLHEQKRNPSPGLDQFIQRFHLEGYDPSRSQ